MADAATTAPPADTNQSGTFIRWWRQARTSFFWMVLVAFVLRFAWIIVAHTYRFKTFDDNFSFGWEMGRIGRSLALGQGFSNPFSDTTGPTAWEPPLYPFLIAGVFKLFGIYTHASAVVLLGINSVFSALTCIPIFLITRRCFSEKLAVWTAWLWAVMPSGNVLVHALGVGDKSGGAAARADFLADPRPGRTRRTRSRGFSSDCFGASRR